MMGFAEGLMAREFAVRVVEGVQVKLDVVAAMWDTTCVLLMGGAVTEQGKGKIKENNI